MGRWRSGQSHHTVNVASSDFGGSNPSLPTLIIYVAVVAQLAPSLLLAHVAQLVEHVIGNDEVSGSIPLVGSKVTG
jgi:hypothetical protein